MIAEYVEEARRELPVPVLPVPDELVVADTRHRWGAAPFHYAPGLYEWVANQVEAAHNIAIPRDALGCRAALRTTKSPSVRKRHSLRVGWIWHGGQRSGEGGGGDVPGAAGAAGGQGASGDALAHAPGVMPRRWAAWATLR